MAQKSTPASTSAKPRKNGAAQSVAAKAKTSEPGLEAPTTADDISAQLATLKKDMAELAGTVADFGKTKLAAAQGSAKETGSDLKAAGQEHAAAIRDHASEMTEHANRYIRTNPLAALGLAAAVGFTVGMLSKRR